MVKLAYTLDSGSSAERCVGSNPTGCTNKWNGPIVYRLGHLVLIQARGVRLSLGLPKHMKAVTKLFLIFTSLVVIALLVIRFLELKAPQVLLEHFSEKASSEDWLIRLDSINWRFPGRISVKGLRVLNRKKAEAKPFLIAEDVTFRLSLTRFPWSLKRIVKSITVTKLKMPRLPEGYYIPDSIEFPGSTDFKERNEPLDMSIPEMKSFKLTLINPDILDLKAKRVTV